MKKSILLLLFVTGFAIAQERIPEYKASNNITYKEGDTIALGRGSGFQGTFVYVQVAGWLTGVQPVGIGSAYSGLNVVLKKIKKAKFKGSEKIFFIVGGGNITNYQLIIEDAIASCEIKDCIKAVNQQVQVIQTDKYDKLKKLKELLADGTISQEEFDAEKKKILLE